MLKKKIIFKRIAVHLDTYKAFKRLQFYIQEQGVFGKSGEHVSCDHVLACLLWDFEAACNLPDELRREVFVHNLKYIEKRFKEMGNKGDNPL